MSDRSLIVQLNRAFIRPHDLPEVYAIIGAGLYVGRTDPTTPTAIAVARDTVDTWNITTVSDYNLLYDQAEKYAAYRGLDTAYGIIDVIVAYDPEQGTQAAYATMSIDPVKPTAINPIVHSTRPALTDSLIRTWTADHDTARDIARLAAGTGSSAVFRSDFFGPDMEQVDLVPAGFRANTTVAYDPVFTVCPPRVGEDFTFDAVLANITHTATVRNKI